ncbi:hypothetical protein AAU61_18960 [Desulfocarbo indianensis]|nr:hypothetical protein AAU61_18960 [Desulfocarbo indianensis]
MYFRGRLDAEALPELSEALSAVDLSRHKNIVLNLGGVTSISSTVIGLLFDFHKRAEQAQARVALEAAPQHIFSIFRAISLDQVIAISPA